MQKIVSIKDIYTVKPIKKHETKEWFLKKHYVHRMPPISYAIGLFDKEMTLQGVCTFGVPASRFNFGTQPLELNRLVTNNLLGKNILSYFVSRCLSILSSLASPCVVVSYADPNNGHHGYIYQATNWKYTGLSSGEHVIYLDKRPYHRRTVYGMCGTTSYTSLIKMYDTVEFIKEKPKHRYFYFLGTKRQVKDMKSKLPYPVLPYPKGDNKRYDSSYKPSTQGILL